MGLLSKIFSNARKPEGFWGKMIDGMHTYTPDELKAHLCAAGFNNIVIYRKESKHLLAVTAEKKNI